MSALARDTLTVFSRAMRLSLRNPTWLVIMMIYMLLPPRRAEGDRPHLED